MNYKYNALFLAIALTACGGGGGSGGGSAYSIGGVTEGLDDTLILQNNGGNDIVINADGVFQFAGKLRQGESYNVTITGSPGDQVCEIAGHSGTVGNADVFDIDIDCRRRPETVVYISSDNLSLVAVTDDGTEEATVLAEALSSVGGQQLSPNEEYVAYLADAAVQGQFDLYVREIDGGESVKIAEAAPGSRIQAFRWSPQSDRIAYLANSSSAVDDFQLFVVNVDGSGSERVSVDIDFTTVGAFGEFAWSPDGMSLAYSLSPVLNPDNPVQLYVKDLSAPGGQNTLLFSIAQNGRQLNDVDWAPTGGWIGFRSDDNQPVRPSDVAEGQYQIYVVAPEGGQSARIVNGTPGTTVTLDRFDWAHDGRFMVHQVRNLANGLLAINFADIDDRTSVRISNATGSAKWSSASARLAFSDPQLKVFDANAFAATFNGTSYDTSPEEHIVPISQDGTRVLSFDWSPDDALLRYNILGAGREDTLYIRDNRAILDEVPVHVSPGRIFAVEWAPNSEHLAFIGNDNNLFTWYVSDMEGNEVPVSTAGSLRNAPEVEWSSDSVFVVYGIEQSLFSNSILGEDTLDLATEFMVRPYGFTYADESLLEEVVVK